MNLVVTDPPYNTRREQDSDNFVHDLLSQDDMEQFVEFVQEFLARCGHGITFFYTYQFRRWYQLLFATYEEDEEDP